MQLLCAYYLRSLGNWISYSGVEIDIMPLEKSRKIRLKIIHVNIASMKKISGIFEVIVFWG
jgi:hypothetical protein